MERDDAMNELLSIQRKTLWHARLRTVLIIALAAPLIVIAAMTGRSVEGAERAVRETEERVDTVIAEVSRLSGHMATLSASVSALAKEVDPDGIRELADSLKDTLSAVSDAARNVAKLDPEAVNSLLVQLDGEIEGISGALDTVRQLDPAAINNLLGQLDDVMATLDKLTNALDKISGWKLFG